MRVFRTLLPMDRQTDRDTASQTHRHADRKTEEKEATDKVTTQQEKKEPK